MSLSMQLGNIKAAMDRNPKIASWSGNNPPYGYVDWWPTGLGFNDMKEPYNDPEIRRAINNVLNRDEIVKIGYQGAGENTVVPYPGFPALNEYTKGIADLLQKYPVDDFNLEKSAAIDAVERATPRTRAASGPRTATDSRSVVITFPVEQDVTPVIVQQLRKGGFDASFKMPSNFGDSIFNGDADAYVFGHGGSVSRTRISRCGCTRPSSPRPTARPRRSPIAGRTRSTTSSSTRWARWLRTTPSLPTCSTVGGNLAAGSCRTFRWSSSIIATRSTRRTGRTGRMRTTRTSTVRTGTAHLSWCCSV